ncbi:CPBP family intramembrane glutamic endopeptidase [Naasia lichenicola]|uniref:CPBP family intramembrane metalloprotease n=1 Tax=Naasia lichenicola TaxID=2565933 RepID=A0A4S4FUA1_9MICO|nr:type II CAAX endopeptidase family protein [Naasia lichenicola]THG33176.1 CPBP family intramembrane metalloprotease [Naasia lichenicola]
MTSDALSAGVSTVVSRWAVAPATGVAISAVLLFAVHLPVQGHLLLVASVAAAWPVGREFFKDLLLVGVGLTIAALITLKADLSWSNMLSTGAVLALAVLAPFLVDRKLYRNETIRFPVRTGRPWSRIERIYLGVALFLAWLILPFYFLNSGVWQNWPAADSPEVLGKLLIGVIVVGIWDELFFVATIFTLLRRHLPMWQANLLQAVIFISVLWELGYRGWGPLITIPFAMLQAWIFTKTKSLSYVVSVHLLFDLVVYLVLVHAHNPDWLRIFLY